MRVFAVRCMIVVVVFDHVFGPMVIIAMMFDHVFGPVVAFAVVAVVAAIMMFFSVMVFFPFRMVIVVTAAFPVAMIAVMSLASVTGVRGTRRGQEKGCQHDSDKNGSGFHDLSSLS